MTERQEEFATYTSIELVPVTYLSDAPFVLSFHLLPESRNLVLILANGEIVLHPADESNSSWDVVGAFEGGLEAARWSPDDSLVILATADGKLVQMTTDFEALHEKTLRTIEFGEDAQVNVNWGSKATQFHGSLGKVAATSTITQIPGCSPDDDNRVRISWRGDAAYFAVSTSDKYEDADGPTARRVIRVYDRDATLQSTLEPTPGLEHCLAWRPSGNFIATAQRFFSPESGFPGGGLGRHGRHDIVFFERNGLRRLEFDGQWIKQDEVGAKEDPWSYKIKDMSWSCDSEILAVWVSRKGIDVVQLWTTGNWHWYLKLELHPLGSPRFLSMAWHPEHPRTLVLTSEASIFEYTFEYDTVTSLGGPPNDLGMVAVIDKGAALITPFRMQNVPPPAAAYTLQVGERLSPPIHMAISPSSESLVAIHLNISSPPSATLRLWQLNPRRTPGRGKIMTPQQIVSQTIDSFIPFQVTLTESTDACLVSILGQELDGQGSIKVFRVLKEMCTEEFSASCPANGRLVPSGDPECGLIWQSREGTLFHAQSMEPFSSFPEFCFYSQIVFIVHDGKRTALAIGLSTRSRLYVTLSGNKSAVVVNPAVTSFVVAGSFLIYLTTAHESTYAPLTDLVSSLAIHGEENDSQTSATKIASLSSVWEKRRVERGSRIVTAVPSAMNVVLQMPRGNLETINPRPLALEVIRSDIARLEYGKAFSACRKHRIDLNILVEEAPSVFLDNIAEFPKQVSDVDDLNLFLTVFGRSKAEPELVTKVCAAIRQELEKTDPIKYINTVLTSYVVQSPPDYEEALSHLHRLQEQESSIVEDAVRYVIFLVDADKLFDVALGMYDFTLVLLIAQHSQRDPREYLPFLRELKALDAHYQKFKIDDYLKRYPKALASLFAGGSPRFAEALRYVEMHQLYKEALVLWQDEQSEYESYGDWMFDRREFSDAALAYQSANRIAKSMLAYEKSHSWRPLFYLATETGLPKDKIIEMAYRVAEELCTRKRWTDAAAVYNDYACDIEEAIRAFANGNELAEALRLASKHQKQELVGTIIHPGALDLSSQIYDDLEEMEEQLKKQYSRLQELRLAKSENPDAFFGVEDLSLHNVDVKTDVSTPFTTFTRYTKAPTSASRSVSGRTSRSKRKLDMKNAAGRRGTAEEETYIMTSWGKLACRLEALQSEAGKLLPHLYLFSKEHKDEGERLQKTILQFQSEFERMVNDIWSESASPNNEEEPSSSIKPIQGDVSGKLVPSKPSFAAQNWTVRLWI
ncbi:hypothetical protein M408DRAFT_149581 [Serendipita vermifera MAFF 305830]|uniref:Elongator complex protein 1 n=1 Tax=Serendipita vermifera MAFF 305830 TaxID=933852 RepID=A0A0C3B8L6_SERVB|nr:hypothetical protein M408DRAFT_149581 [Serendipita vermifera MAFF 305830]